MTGPPTVRPGRKPEGVAALLLPFDADGESDLDGLTVLMRTTLEAGLGVAVNMDTGFGPQISPAQRREVVRLARAVCGDHGFIAGAMPFGRHEKTEDAYRAEVFTIVEAGGTPILFPSPEMPDEVAPFVRTVLRDVPAALAFELSTDFVPFGRILSDDEIRALMDVPNLVGLKHSSLDRRIEWQRLRLRDARRPDFRIYSGNDLAVDMVRYGSDYLLGLACFDPEAFAQRDAWWTAGDARSYALDDALQALGAIAFRDPIPAYKDSCATYLRLTGRLHDPRPHPDAHRRHGIETVLLGPFAQRVTEAKQA